MKVRELMELLADLPPEADLLGVLDELGGFDSGVSYYHNGQAMDARIDRQGLEDGGDDD